MLYHRNGFFVLEALSVTRAPAPAELYRQTAAQLQTTGNDPAAWLELARWAESMADQYRIPELRDLAADARRRARDAEFAAVPPGDTSALRDLLKRHHDDLDPDQRRYHWFRVFWWELRALERTEDVTGERWRKLSEEIRDRLPGAAEPLRSVDPALLERFQAGDPVAVYRKQQRARRALERLLLRRVERRYLAARQRELVPERWPELAEEARRLLPDVPEVAEQLFEAWITYQQDRFDQLSRAEVLRSFDRIRKRDAERAREFLRAWLRRREALLPEDDLVGRINLARDYQDLLGDDQAAIPLLLEVVQQNPTHPEASQRLHKLGYRYRRGVWYGPDGRAVSPQERPRRQPERSTPQQGDSAQQVLAIMGSLPTRIARLGTATGVIEVWQYEGPNGTIVVLFRVSAGRKVVETVYRP